MKNIYSDFTNNSFNNILMNTEQINEYNQKILSNSEYLYDVFNIQSITKRKIKEYITAYKMSETTKYDGNYEISAEDKEKILENCAIEKIEDLKSIQKGLTIKRCNMRAFPTEISFYDKKGVKDFDRIQETEIRLNTPLLILHQSRDGMWAFVITSTYVGWILKENIVCASSSDWDYFINNKKFGVITAASININGEILDMGTTLPYLDTKNDKIVLALPTKDSNDEISKKEIYIDKNVCHIGFLPFTKNNIILEAFKYHNYPYSWGGKNESVDCSSYIMNIFKTFGFNLPRNGSPQRDSFINKTNLKELNYDEKIKLLKNKSLALLYMPGHVMLYLGYKEKKFYIIHSNGGDMKVSVTDLLDTTYIEKLDTLVDIDFI